MSAPCLWLPAHRWTNQSDRDPTLAGIPTAWFHFPASAFMARLEQSTGCGPPFESVARSRIMPRTTTCSGMASRVSILSLKACELANRISAPHSSSDALPGPWCGWLENLSSTPHGADSEVGPLQSSDLFGLGFTSFVINS